MAEEQQQQAPAPEKNSEQQAAPATETPSKEPAKAEQQTPAALPPGHLMLNGIQYQPVGSAPISAPAGPGEPAKASRETPEAKDANGQLYRLDDQGRFVPAGDGFKPTKDTKGDGGKGQEYAGGKPPATGDGALTMEQIRNMSAADINARWDDVQKVLGKR